MKRPFLRLVALIALTSCSSLAPKPPEVECITNEDCNEDPGFVCDLGVCRDGGDAPPLALIGFDLQEVAGGQAQFRTEIAGCDREVLSEGTTIPVLTLPRHELARRLELGVVSGADEVPLPATFELTQGSRFKRDPHRRLVRFEPLPEESLEDALVEVSWPRYFVDNFVDDFVDNPLPYLGEGGYLVWLTQPLSVEDSVPAAQRYQQLAPPATLTGEMQRSCLTDLDCCPDAETCEPEDFRHACVTSLRECRDPSNEAVRYTYVYTDACDRLVEGRVVVVDEQLSILRPLPETSLSMRHADPDRVAPLGLPRLDITALELREPECTADDECAEGLICNEDTEQCELPLAGFTAWTGTVTPDAEPGFEGQFDAHVYNYCDGLPEGPPVLRSFDVTVTPPEESNLPTIVLRSDVVFSPLQAGGQKPPASFGGDLCVPEFGATQDITLALSGEPRTLLTDYSCCDVDCLPRTKEDADDPPQPPTLCSGASAGAAATFRAESPLQFDEQQLEAWNAEDSPCVGVRADEDGTVGVIRSSGACGTPDDSGATTPQQCDLSLRDNGDTPRTYDLRIETPPGSVLGSVDTELTVDAAAGTTLTPVELPQRVLVRGRVVVEDCVETDEDDSDCGSPGAKVLAERVRMAGESEANVAGPYFHQISTFFDPTEGPGQNAGAYVLPLDPGVWVVTALPDSGTDGGPAKISVLDLRTGPADFPFDFQLEGGILVTVDVSSFDRRSEMIPLDTGSYEDLSNPDTGVALDLGAAGECLSSEGASVGCRIRRLVGGSSLPPSQIGQVRFTARSRETNTAADCTPPS
ncbi:MAG: hypothetical protein ACRBN8_04090 [Nannocystales bacterium]